MNNLSNNCYINSTIQCLIKTPNIYKTLEDISLRNADIPLIAQLMEITKCLVEGDF